MDKAHRKTIPEQSQAQPKEIYQIHTVSTSERPYKDLVRELLQYELVQIDPND